MPGNEFSKAVLVGMGVEGFSAEQIMEITGMSLGLLGLAQSGKKPLTQAMIAAIEEATGMTGGQLAAAGVEPDGGRLTEIADALASARSTAGRRKHAVRQR